MFNIGEMIVYGTEGVFCVSDYANSPIDKHDDRVFYILKPAFAGECSFIYAPSENGRIKMRAVISVDEANAFIKGIPDIPSLEVEQEKKRRQAYKDAMNDADLDVFVKIIKAVRQKREDCVKNKKKLSESDTDYEKKAKFCLYGELATALGIGFNEVENYIINMIGDGHI